MIDEAGEKRTTRSRAVDASPKMLSGGYYSFGSFGANRLHIIQALNEVLSHLEEHHDLKL